MAQYSDNQDELERQLLLEQLKKGSKPTENYGYAPPAYGDLSGPGGSAGPAKSGAKGAASGAMTGASIGSMVGPIGTGLGAGIGAAVGGIGGLFAGRHNDTKDAREEFARSLGQNDTSALWGYLGENAPDAANELRDRALNRIGKHDTAANDQWMRDVQAALDYSAAHPKEEGGVTGGQAAQDARAQNAAEQAAAEDYTQLGKFANSFGAWNGSEKFNRSWDDKSERYKMLTVLSHFDPRQGITPEVIKALNDANIYGAKFSGSGDKLTVDNAGGYARFGKGGTADIIQGFKGGNGTWSPWQVDDNPQVGGPVGAPMGVPGMSSGPSGYQGIVPSDLDFYNKLQARLMEIIGGPQAVERSALLKMLGAK